ncbi:hypothetical protein M407DRAFT_31608, partial [Tulasnella calospora MUT 4182]
MYVLTVVLKGFSHKIGRKDKARGRKRRDATGGEENLSSVKERTIQRPNKRTRGDSALIESHGNRCGFLSLPVELLFLACMDLEPIDILHLSRLTKGFRAVLLSGENCRVWGEAIKRIKGLPRCPPDLSYPAYVSLMFETGCQSIIKTAWPKVPQKLMDAIPRSINLSPQFNTLYVRQLVVDAKLTLDEKEEGSSAYLDTLDDVCRALSTLNAMLRKTGANLRMWAEQDGSARRYLLQEQRIESILKRISELGWSREDFPSRWNDAWNDDVEALVFRPKLLTDGAWEDLYPQIVPVLERHKKRRLRKEAQDCLNTKRKAVWEYFEEWVEDQSEATLYDDENFFLNPRQLLAIPTVAKLIKSSSSATVSKDLWVKNLDKIAATNRTHQERIVAALRLVLIGQPHPQKMRSIELGKDPFEDLHVDFDPTLDLD